MEEKDWNIPEPGEWKSEELSQERIIDCRALNFVGGEGVRSSLCASGCTFRCKGCYNAAARSLKTDIPCAQELEKQIMASSARPYIQGLTLLGGEPSLNTGILLPLIKRVCRELPEKDIRSWTGYTWEEIMQGTPDRLRMLSLIGILVDKRFDITKRNLMLQFRDSSNQRIINVRESLRVGEVII